MARGRRTAARRRCLGLDDPGRLPPRLAASRIAQNRGARAPGIADGRPASRQRRRPAEHPGVIPISKRASRMAAHSSLSRPAARLALLSACRSNASAGSRTGLKGEPGGGGAGTGIAPQERAAGPSVWLCPIAEADRQTARTRIGRSPRRSPTKTRATPSRWQSPTIRGRIQVHRVHRYRTCRVFFAPFSEFAATAATLGGLC